MHVHPCISYENSSVFLPWQLQAKLLARVHWGLISYFGILNKLMVPGLFIPYFSKHLLKIEAFKNQTTISQLNLFVIFWQVSVTA